MYKARNQMEILGELQEKTQNDMSKIEGTFTYDVLASNSIEFAKTEVEIEESYNQRFLDTSTGEYLSLNANQVGCPRKPAIKAIGIVTVKGDGEIPAGSRFATDSGIQFETTKHYYVTKQKDIPIVAVDAGTAGNVDSGLIKNIPMTIPGINSVTNVKPTHDGYNEETDEELRERALFHVRTPGTSGNKFHYYEWAMSVAGVGSAKILAADELKQRNNVKVIITDNNYNVASEKLIQDVKNYIDSVRPPGALVTVVSATPRGIAIKCKVTGDFDKDAFIEKTHLYFNTFAKLNRENASISVAKIGSLIFSAGASDFEHLTLNGGTDSITLKTDEIAVLGEVTIT